MVIKRDILVQNAEREFKEPQHLLEDQDLSDDQKIQILLGWQLDLLDLQRAADENMPSADSPSGEVAEKLQKVSEALEDLRGEVGETSS
jgi:hypothetical protein